MNGSDADEGSGGGATNAEGDGGGAANAEDDGGGRSGETNAREPLTDGQFAGESIVESAVDEAVKSVSTAEYARLKRADRATRPDRVASILVGVGTGPHSGATVDVARDIADATDAWLELFHVVPSDAASADGTATSAADEGRDSDRGEPSASGDDYVETGEQLLSAAQGRLGGFDRVDRWLVEDQTAADAIVEQSLYYDLVLVGAPTTGTVGRFVFGSTTDTVINDSKVPVVVVEAAEPTPLHDD